MTGCDGAPTAGAPKTLRVPESGGDVKGFVSTQRGQLLDFGLNDPLIERA